jgi:PAS domain-containing protein
MALSEARLGEVLGYATDGIAITDLDGRFVRTNAALSRVLEPSAGSSTLFDSICRRGGPDLRSAYRELADGSRDRLTLRLDLAQHNGVFPVSLSATLVRDPDGVAREFVTILA